MGDGATIGPNAVVIADVPAGSLAFAPPASVISQGGFGKKDTESKSQSATKSQTEHKVNNQPQLSSLQPQVPASVISPKATARGSISGLSPPSITSLPSLGRKKSAPAPPRSRSSPPLPKIRSRPAPPSSV